MNRKLRGDLMLITAAMIWGSAFVAQKNGMDLMSPVAFNSVRLMIGGLSLIPVIMIRKRTGMTERKTDSRQERRTLLTGGILCGTALMAAGSIQQISLVYTTAGKAGFITALYVVLVPLFGIFLGKKIRPVIWICVLASAAGLYLLCMPAGSGFGNINKGDLMLTACAVLFAAHILIADHFSPKTDGVKLSCIQFFTAGILSFCFIWLDPVMGFSLPDAGDVAACWFPLLYTGIFSCGVAYTFQIVAQSYTEPAVASMLLCLESVFAVLAGMLLLGESMTLREGSGCVIMFAAIIVAQLPEDLHISLKHNKKKAEVLNDRKEKI